MKLPSTIDQPPAHSGAQIFRAWLPAVVWMALIFLASAQPDFAFVPDAWQADPISFTAHLLEYGVLAALLWRAASRTPRLQPVAFLFAVVVAILYGATDEYHQSFVPGRVPDLRDLVVDAAGAALALALIAWRRRGR